MVNPLHLQATIKAAAAAARAKKGKTAPAEEKKSILGKIFGFFRPSAIDQFHKKRILKNIKKEARDIHTIFALFELRDRAFEKKDYDKVSSITDEIIEIIRNNLNIDKNICRYEASYFYNHTTKFASEESKLEWHKSLFARSSKLKQEFVKEHQLEENELTLLKGVVSDLVRLVHDLLSQRDAFKQERYKKPDSEKEKAMLEQIKIKLIDLEIVDKKLLIEEEMEKAA